MHAHLLNILEHNITYMLHVNITHMLHGFLHVLCMYMNMCVWLFYHILCVLTLLMIK